MTVRRLIGAASAVGVLSAAALIGFTGLASAQEEKKEWFTLSASGSGDDEVPAGTGAEGTRLTGSFSITADGDLTYTVKVSGNEEEIEAAHIHKGAEGENGDVVIELDAKAINEGEAAKVEVEADLAQRIIDNPGNWYVNTHSESFQPPTGVARAQLVGAEDVEKPEIINTGTGGQFADANSGPGAGALAAGGLLIVSAIGGVYAIRRRPGADNS